MQYVAKPERIQIRHYARTKKKQKQDKEAKNSISESDQPVLTRHRYPRKEVPIKRSVLEGYILKRNLETFLQNALSKTPAHVLKKTLRKNGSV